MDKTIISNVQKMLNKILGVNMAVDGIAGKQTKRYTKMFKEQIGLKPINNSIGQRTIEAIQKHYDGNYKQLNVTRPTFTVFCDAGHSGVDENGRYLTQGKRAYYDGEQIHDGCNYYEGYENRIISEMFIQECNKLGINCIRTYHPIIDYSLKDRADIVNGWLEMGYYGYLHSFHSNAIAKTNTPQKLENTIGFQVYTTKGQTLSDKIATIHYDNSRVAMRGTGWKFLQQKWIDNDPDYEANFKILRDTDNGKFEMFGAILEEWGFHTSRKDTLFITKQENRKRRVQAAVATAFKAKVLFNQL